MCSYNFLFMLLALCEQTQTNHMFKKNNKKQEETINKIEQNKSTSSKADGQETDKNNWGIAYSS